MSIFGFIMAIVAILWTIISMSWFLASDDLYMFLMDNGYLVFIGYIVIVVITIVAKKIVKAM